MLPPDWSRCQSHSSRLCVYVVFRISPGPWHAILGYSPTNRVVAGKGDWGRVSFIVLQVAAVFDAAVSANGSVGSCLGDRPGSIYTGWRFRKRR